MVSCGFTFHFSNDVVFYVLFSDLRMFFNKVFKYFAHLFLLKFFICIHIYLSIRFRSVYVFGSDNGSDTYFASILFQFTACLFILLTVSSAEQSL